MGGKYGAIFVISKCHFNMIPIYFKCTIISYTLTENNCYLWLKCEICNGTIIRTMKKAIILQKSRKRPSHSNPKKAAIWVWVLKNPRPKNLINPKRRPKFQILIYLPEYPVFSTRYQPKNFILFLRLVAGTKYILTVFGKKNCPVFEL